MILKHSQFRVRVCFTCAALPVFFRWFWSSLVAPSWKVLGRAASSMVNSGVLSWNRAISTDWAACYTQNTHLDFVDQTGWQLLQVVLWLTMGCCEVAFETRILFNLWFWTEMQVYSYEIKLKYKKQNKPKTMVVTIKQNLQSSKGDVIAVCFLSACRQAFAEDWSEARQKNMLWQKFRQCHKF